MKKLLVLIALGLGANGASAWFGSHIADSVSSGVSNAVNKAKHQTEQALHTAQNLASDAVQGNISWIAEDMQKELGKVAHAVNMIPGMSTIGQKLMGSLGGLLGGAGSKQVQELPPHATLAEKAAAYLKGIQEALTPKFINEQLTKYNLSVTPAHVELFITLTLAHFAPQLKHYFGDWNKLNTALGVFKLPADDVAKIKAAFEKAQAAAPAA